MTTQLLPSRKERGSRNLCLLKQKLYHRSLVVVLVVFATFVMTSMADGLSRFLLEREINFYRSAEIPKKLHFMILGEDPPQYMLEMVKFNRKHVETLDPDFTTKLWRDDDVEKLVQDQNDPALTQAWEYVKADERVGRYAKMADFIRPLILYVEGGVYLDADMVPCGGLSFMVDEPGVVTFPFTLAKHIELNGAASSAPKGHRLMKMAMEYFIAKGSAITTEHNLDAAGPRAMALVVDRYIHDLGKKHKDLRHIPFPHFHRGEEDVYASLPDLPEVVLKGDGYAKIADIKYSRWPFGGPNENIYHLQSRSW